MPRISDFTAFLAGNPTNSVGTVRAMSLPFKNKVKMRFPTKRLLAGVVTLAACQFAVLFAPIKKDVPKHVL
jgi:hypothetical protein